MTNILSILEAKVDLLKKFKLVTLAYRSSLQKDKFETVSKFNHIRGKILDKIEGTDKELLSVSQEVSNLDIQEKQAIDLLLEEKKKVVDEILATDLEVMALIDKKKSDIFDDIKKLQKGKRGIRGYKNSTKDVD